MSSASGNDYASDFSEVHRAEIAWLNRRRGPGGALEASGGSTAASAEAKRISASEMPVQGSGIAISGGGIRSAAFALGALQALDQDRAEPGRKTGGLRRFDYLSTVSGGGYIGASVRVGMQASGAFPFSAETGDKKDNAAVGHIRNHSRYLIPGGLPDLVGCLVVVLRGFAANAVMVFAGLLVLAGLTGLANPNQPKFEVPDVLGWDWFPSEGLMRPILEPFGAFAYTTLLLLLGLVFLLAWAIRRSLPGAPVEEFKGRWPAAAFIWFALTSGSAFFELQPYAVRGVFYFGKSGDLLGAAANLISVLSPYAAALAAVGAFASRYLGDILATTGEKTGLVALARTILAKAALLFMAAALPLILWIVYLNITLATDIGYHERPVWLANVVTWFCGAPDPSLPLSDNRRACLLACGAASGNKPLEAPVRLIAWIFTGAGLLLLALTWIFRPNANSLHRLYRDRLGKAFLFDPRPREGRPNGEDPPYLGDMWLAEIRPETGPLHLINCALNVQGSKFVNRRGRNADFFFFSPVYSGSSATGFLRTEASATLPDVGTAVAISGAAASSNMGANTVWGLAPTLALLNIRLGYWLDNPMRLKPGFAPTAWERIRDSMGLYLVSEMFSRLDERAKQVYLTDGGHIENLGLYELLRRRVKLIVVIDAEADPTLAFGSLIEAQRFARIDLGVRIDLPWRAIHDASLAVDAETKAGAPADAGKAADRPHVAVGTIEYGEKERGTLVYVKASMTGDENDYVAAYKRRHPAFPHETTGDQFFSEEQFEAYRALGFHALHSAFEGKTRIAGLETPAASPQPIVAPPSPKRRKPGAGEPIVVPPPAAPTPSPKSAFHAVFET